MNCDVCSKELKDTDITMIVTSSNQKYIPVGEMHRRCYIISFGIIRDSVRMGEWLTKNDEERGIQT